MLSYVQGSTAERKGLLWASLGPSYQPTTCPLRQRAARAMRAREDAPERDQLALVGWEARASQMPPLAARRHPLLRVQQQPVEPCTRPNGEPLSRRPVKRARVPPGHPMRAEASRDSSIQISAQESSAPHCITVLELERPESIRTALRKNWRRARSQPRGAVGKHPS